MDNIQDNNTTMPEGMMNIQRLASTLNDDPVSVAAITFDILRNVTNGFNAQHVVFLLVNITRDNLREYLRDTIFDAVRMDNELLSSDMRINDEVLENRLDEIWRQVTTKLRYAGRHKARRRDILRTMLDPTPYTKNPPPTPPRRGEGLPPTPPEGKGVEMMPTVHLIINNNNSNSQSQDDKRRIAMSGNDSTYNENTR